MVSGGKGKPRGSEGCSYLQVREEKKRERKKRIRREVKRRWRKNRRDGKKAWGDLLIPMPDEKSER